MPGGLLAERLGKLLGQRLHLHAEPAANNLAVFDDRFHHLQRKLHRDGESDALRTAGLGNDGGVDADQVASCIHQRAARVATVDRSIGLDEVLVGVEAQLVATGGADDAHGDGLPDAEGVAYRQGDVAYANAVGMAERDGGQVG